MGLHLITFYILQNYQNNYNDFLIKMAMLGEQKKSLNTNMSSECVVTFY